MANKRSLEEIAKEMLGIANASIGEYVATRTDLRRWASELLETRRTSQKPPSPQKEDPTLDDPTSVDGNENVIEQ